MGLPFRSLNWNLVTLVFEEPGRKLGNVEKKKKTLKQDIRSSKKLKPHDSQPKSNPGQIDRRQAATLTMEPLDKIVFVTSAKNFCKMAKYLNIPLQSDTIRSALPTPQPANSPLLPCKNSVDHKAILKYSYFLPLSLLFLHFRTTLL